MFRKGSLVVTSLFVLSCSSVGPGRPLTLDEIIDRHARAIGGRRAIENTEALRIDATVREPKFTVRLRVHFQRPAQMRVDVDLGNGRIYTEAFDGASGWERRPDGTVSGKTPDAERALRHSTLLPGNIRGLHELRPLGHDLMLLGAEQIEGRSEYILRLRLDDGYEVRYHIDAESFLITRKVDERALHPDVSPEKQTIEARYGDYRRVAGVLRSFRSVDSDRKTGDRIQETIIHRIDVVPPQPKEFFSRPASPDA